MGIESASHLERLFYTPVEQKPNETSQLSNEGWKADVSVGTSGPSSGLPLPSRFDPLPPSRSLVVIFISAVHKDGLSRPNCANH